MAPTKRAYLTRIPFVTHLPADNNAQPPHPIFKSEYNSWHWHTTNCAYHPINSIHPGINPFRNLFAELVDQGRVIYFNNTYTIRDPSGFLNVCKQYQINPKFPPQPIFTAPTGDAHCFRAIAEYYNLFATYVDITSQHYWLPYYDPTPLTPTDRETPGISSLTPGDRLYRRHIPEYSDSSSSRSDHPGVRPDNTFNNIRQAQSASDRLRRNRNLFAESHQDTSDTDIEDTIANKRIKTEPIED